MKVMPMLALAATGFICVPIAQAQQPETQRLAGVLNACLSDFIALSHRFRTDVHLVERQVVLACEPQKAALIAHERAQDRTNGSAVGEHMARFW